MGTVSKDQEQFIVENYSKLSGDQISAELNLTKNQIRNIAYRHKIAPKRGRSKFSYRPTRHFSVNDDYFSHPTIENCYWAGLIASDGCITSDHTVQLGFKTSDQYVLEEFKRRVNFEGSIYTYKKNYSYKGVQSDKFYSCVSINSTKMVNDLRNNFNITSRKSLTLQPPNLGNEELIDSFIVGLIDGDGSIGNYKCQRQTAIQISLLGTLEVLNWVKNRFSSIVGKDIKGLYKKRKGTGGNTFSLHVNDRTARNLFMYFYKLPIFKFDRKWSSQNYDYCCNYTKFRNVDKYKTILKMERSGLSIYEIAKELNVTYQAIFWYKKQKLYSQLSSIPE
jgi:hypothetical protein